MLVGMVHDDGVKINFIRLVWKTFKILYFGVVVYLVNT